MCFVYGVLYMFLIRSTHARVWCVCLIFSYMYPFSPRLAHILDETPHHIITTHTTLPDILTNIPHIHTHVHINSNGWCLLSYQDMIYIWNYNDIHHIIMMITNDRLNVEHIKLQCTDKQLNGIMAGEEISCCVHV